MYDYDYEESVKQLWASLAYSFRNTSDYNMRKVTKVYKELVRLIESSPNKDQTKLIATRIVGYGKLTHEETLLLLKKIRSGIEDFAEEFNVRLTE